MTHPIHDILGTILTGLLIAIAIPAGLLAMFMCVWNWLESGWQERIDEIQPQPDTGPGTYGAPRNSEERTSRRIKISEAPEIYEETGHHFTGIEVEPGSFEWGNWEKPAN